MPNARPEADWPPAAPRHGVQGGPAPCPKEAAWLAAGSAAHGQRRGPMETAREQRHHRSGAALKLRAWLVGLPGALLTASPPPTLRPCHTVTSVLLGSGFQSLPLGREREWGSGYTDAAFAQNCVFCLDVADVKWVSL